MLVCWRGVYLSSCSSTQTCTYIKKKLQAGIMDAPKRERGAYIERQKNPRQWHIISLARVTTPPPPSLLLPAATVGYQSLHQSILPTSTPLPFKYQAPQVGARGDGEKRACLMRRSPQLHGASASPACRHAAIHRLITMEERSSRWVKVGCTDCNQLPVAVFFFFFYALHITFQFLCAAQPPVWKVTASWQVS